MHEICSVIFIPKILAVPKVAFLGSRFSIDGALSFGAESDNRKNNTEVNMDNTAKKRNIPRRKTIKINFFTNK